MAFTEKPVHPNVGVVYAIKDQASALMHLNMADGLFADEPFHLQREALKVLLGAAFPHLDPGRILLLFFDSGEGIDRCIRWAQEEWAETQRPLSAL